MSRFKRRVTLDQCPFIGNPQGLIIGRDNYSGHANVSIHSLHIGSVMMVKVLNTGADCTDKPNYSFYRTEMVDIL